MAEAAVNYDAGANPEENEGNDHSIASTNDTYPGEFKVILLGTNGVGKTSLFLHIKDGKFYSNTRDIRTTDRGLEKTIQVGREQVQMTLYDTATGMEYHESKLTRNYYRDSLVALLVYSADRIDSVTKMVNCIAQVNEDAPEASKIVIRNKVDLEDQTVRDHEVDAKITAKGYQLSTIKHFCSTSALNGSGIDDLLQKIGKIILHKRRASVSANKQAINSFDTIRDNIRANQEARQTETRQSNCPC